MAVSAVDIHVNIPQIQGGPIISIDELKEKVQTYVNTLYVRVSTDVKQPVNHKHSLSSLRGICKSDLTDEEALDKYLNELSVPVCL